MDEVSNRVLVELLKNGRISKRRIATLTGVSHSLVSYKISQMAKRGILQGFMTYVSPTVFGLRRAIVMLPGKVEYELSSLQIWTVEGDTILEVYARDRETLRRRLEDLTKAHGKPSLVLELPRGMVSLTPRDRVLVEQIVERPRIMAKTIAETLNLTVRTASRHVRFLVNMDLIKVLPILDLPRTGSSMIAAFLERQTEVAPKNLVWEFLGEKEKLSLYYVWDKQDLKQIMEGLRGGLVRNVFSYKVGLPKEEQVVRHST